jgi:chromate reductase, NAD(P)H dehydrogenase (quinone)
MRLLAISGSLRRASSNTTLLRAAALLAPDGVSVHLYGGLADLPAFNPDLDTDAPPQPVADLRRCVGEADGLIISSPEYAHGIAGALKNALDWLVRSVEFPFTPVAIFNASPRATHAPAQLREVLVTMSARLVASAAVTLPLSGRIIDERQVAGEPQLADPLRVALAQFVAAIAQQPR